jgi:hypothetical protein
MVAYLIVSIVGGVLFGVMDGLVNANPLATRLYQVYKPLARPALNLPAGVVIDLVYGFALAGLYLLLYQSLPGQTGIVKGVSFGIGVWFLRVVMQVASQWMMFVVPGKTLLYVLVTGLGEMLVLGILYGLTLRPSA